MTKFTDAIAIEDDMDMSENEDDHDMNDETIKDKLKHYVEEREHENVEDSHKSTVNQDFNEDNIDLVIVTFKYQLKMKGRKTWIQKLMRKISVTLLMNHSLVRRHPYST